MRPVFLSVYYRSEELVRAVCTSPHIYICVSVYIYMCNTYISVYIYYMYLYIGVLSVYRCVRPVVWGTLCLARWSEELVKVAGRYVYRYISVCISVCYRCIGVTFSARR